MVLFAGKVPKVNPPPVKIFGHWALTGHTAATGAVVAVQLATLQLRPAVAVSLTTLLLAAVLPELTKVTVKLVVEPAAMVVVPFVFCTSNTVEQVLVTAGFETLRVDIVPVVANQAEVAVIVGVSKPLAPPLVLTVGAPAVALK